MSDNLRAFAAAYVQEFYENQYAEQHDGDSVHDLPQEQFAKFEELVDREIDELHGTLTQACDTWAADASRFADEGEA